jgi:hypothetical protein
MGLYEPGQRVERYFDYTPSTVSPRPEGLPTTVKYRTIVSQGGMTIAWSAGGHIFRLDFPMTPEELVDVNSRGGNAGPYKVAMAGGCSSCSGKDIKGWDPEPGVIWVERGWERLVGSKSATYGLVPPRA